VERTIGISFAEMFLTSASVAKRAVTYVKRR
jgi:hypothetical protein